MLCMLFVVSPPFVYNIKHKNTINDGRAVGPW